MPVCCRTPTLKFHRPFFRLHLFQQTSQEGRDALLVDNCSGATFRDAKGIPRKLIKSLMWMGIKKGRPFSATMHLATTQAPSPENQDRSSVLFQLTFSTMFLQFPNLGMFSAASPPPPPPPRVISSRAGGPALPQLELAVLLAGLALVPLSPSEPLPRLRLQLEDATRTRIHWGPSGGRGGAKDVFGSKRGVSFFWGTAENGGCPLGVP